MPCGGDDGEPRSEFPSPRSAVPQSVRELQRPQAVPPVRGEDDPVVQVHRPDAPVAAIGHRPEPQGREACAQRPGVDQDGRRVRCGPERGRDLHIPAIRHEAAVLAEIATPLEAPADLRAERILATVAKVTTAARCTTSPWRASSGATRAMLATVLGWAWSGVGWVASWKRSEPSSEVESHVPAYPFGRISSRNGG